MLVTEENTQKNEDGIYAKYPSQDLLNLKTVSTSSYSKRKEVNKH